MNTRPVATILAPANNSFYYAGQTINLSGTGTDQQSPPESLTYNDVVGYLEQARTSGQGSMLKTIFGGASSELLLTHWLADESNDHEILDKQALSELLRLIEARLGLSLPDGTSPADAKTTSGSRPRRSSTS